MSDIIERNESSGAGVTKKPVETTEVSSVETTAECIAETAIKTVTEITVASVVETAIDDTVEKFTGTIITADKPITSGTTESVLTEEGKKTELSTTEPSTTTKLKGPCIPKGKYALVSVDVDTTGRRLIDEIVQLAAYTPDNEFSQYIMPIMNLNPAARQRHQIRVITVGFFRMLKSMRTYKVVKTKTEISTLTDFLEYLEKINANTPESLGVILIYHEQRKFIPYMILEAMGKYGLLPRFFNVVKACLDGFSLTELKMGNASKYFSLEQMSKVLLDIGVASDTTDRSDFEGNASIRARLAYQIIENFVVSENKDEKSEPKEMLDIVVANAAPIDRYVGALSDQNKCMERQNSLRSIFVNYFKVTLYHRVKGVTFRRVLAEHEYDLEKLSEIWMAKKKEGLAEVIATIEDLKSEDKNELIDLLDCHFDPEKQAVLPIVKKHRPKRGKKLLIKSKSNGMPASPDSTNKTTKRSSRRRRISHKAHSDDKPMEVGVQMLPKNEVTA